MSTPLRPQHFCARPNGTLVPLIAVDELPVHINIQGAPRVLLPGDTQGMTSLGTVTPRCQYYTVEGVVPSFIRYHGSTNANGSGQRGREYEGQAPAPRYVANDNGMGAQRLSIPMYPHGTGQNWMVANPSPAHGWLVPSNIGAGAGAGAGHHSGNGQKSKKEYCSYWIRHGECDYQQQGCLYKHEMPADRSMLEKLGLRDIPRWFRDKYGVSSVLANGAQRDLRGNPNNGQTLDDVQERGSLKATHHAARLALDAAAEKAEAEKATKDKALVSVDPSAAVPFTGKPMFSSNVSPPKGPSFNRASKQVAITPPMQNPVSNVHGLVTQSQANASKKIDLLSFDSISEYPAFDMGSIGQKDATSSEERMDREEFLRNMHGILGNNPTSGNTNSMSGSMDFMPHQACTKTIPFKSRRLYQPREDNSGPGMETNKSDFEDVRRPGALLYNAAAKVVAQENGTSPILVSPTTGLVKNNGKTSVSPIQVTPSTQSCSSSSQPSPHNFGRRAKKGGDVRPLLPPIGTFTHRTPAVFNPSTAFSSAQDMFGMDIRRAK